MNQNVNVSTPDATQRTVVEWMINDPDGGFQENSLPSKGCPAQFVSISKEDIRNNDVLQDIPDQILKTATIDYQGIVSVTIGADKNKNNVVRYVNVQAQIGKKPNRHTYSHVNVVADRNVGMGLIRQALNESLTVHESRWIVETTPGHYMIQATRPT